MQARLLNGRKSRLIMLAQQQQQQQWLVVVVVMFSNDSGMKQPHRAPLHTATTCTTRQLGEVGSKSYLSRKN